MHYKPTLQEYKLGLRSFGISKDNLPKENFRINHIHHACINGHLERVKEASDQFINVTDSEGFSPLHYAVAGENEDVVKCLLLKGANPNLQDKSEQDRKGWTPLDWAINLKNIRIINLLISHNAKITSEHLLMAVENGQKEIADILYSYKKAS